MIALKNKLLFLLWGGLMLSLATGCAGRSEQNNRRIEQLYKAGRQYISQNRNDSALCCFMEAEKLILTHNNHLSPGKIYAHIGYLWRSAQQYAYSNEWYKKALANYQKTGKKELETSILLYIGDNYRLLDKHDLRALDCYHEAMNLTNNDTLLGNIYQRIGLYYHYAGVVDSALYYLHKSTAYPYFKHEQSIRMLFLGNTYFDENKFDSAKYYFKRALEYPCGLRQESGCYTMLHRIAVLQNDTLNILLYSTLSSQYKDSILHMETQMRHVLLNESNKRAFESDERSNTYKKILAIVTIMIVIGIDGLFIHNRQKNIETIRVREKNADLQRQLHREKLQTNTLLQIKEDIYEKFQSEQNLLAERHRVDYVRRIQQACNGVKLQYPYMSPPYKKAVIKIYTSLLHLDNPNEFKTLVNEQFYGFFEKLERNYFKRSLSQRSATLACLILLETPKEHVEIILEYAQGSYDKQYSRLCTRVGIQDNNQLSIVLRNIMLQ